MMRKYGMSNLSCRLFLLQPPVLCLNSMFRNPSVLQSYCCRPWASPLLGETQPAVSHSINRSGAVDSGLLFPWDHSLYPYYPFQSYILKARCAQELFPSVSCILECKYCVLAFLTVDSSERLAEILRAKAKPHGLPFLLVEDLMSFK